VLPFPIRLLGRARDLRRVRYAITEEFVSVYRMHPLLPDSHRIGSEDVSLRQTRNGGVRKLVERFCAEGIWAPSAPHVPANSCSATNCASGRSCVSPASPHLEPLGESRGRATTLPGDAAYPTTPSLGQGACHAMGDAGVLARCLAEEAPRSSAFSEVRLRCDLYPRFAVQSDRCAEYHPRRCPNLHGTTHRASIQSERSRNASHGSTRTSTETSSGEFQGPAVLILQGKEARAWAMPQQGPSGRAPRCRPRLQEIVHNCGYRLPLKDTAVDDQLLACHVGGGVGGQVQDAGSDLLGLPVALERH
jgi:hypothetical protein